MEPVLIPGAITACPVACQPRPRDLTAYRAACEAAEGADVTVHTAIEIAPGMTCWQTGRWLTATHVVRDGNRVELYFDAGTGTAARHTSLTAEVYVLTGAPATHAEQS